MAVTKKIKSEKKNTYIPHKIRSHPFYFINLPLKCILFFIFYWFVLVPVLYFVFSSYTPGFNAFTLYYFLGMSAVFLAVMGLFLMEWRLKRNKENSEIYYIQYESPSADVDIEQHPVHKTSREMIFLTDKKESPIIEEQKLQKTVNLRKTERPKNIYIEETERPVSQNVISPLTPRELFFLDMYEYANQNMRDVTATFLEREQVQYVPSGPTYSSCETSSDRTDEQYPISEQITLLNELILSNKYPTNMNEQYPKSAHQKYTLEVQNISEIDPVNSSRIEQYPASEESSIMDDSIASDHSNLSKITSVFCASDERKFAPKIILMDDSLEDKRKIGPKTMYYQSPVSEQSFLIDDSISPSHSSLSEVSVDDKRHFVPKIKYDQHPANVQSLLMDDSFEDKRKFDPKTRYYKSPASDQSSLMDDSISPSHSSLSEVPGDHSVEDKRKFGAKTSREQHPANEQNILVDDSMIPRHSSLSEIPVDHSVDNNRNFGPRTSHEQYPAQGFPMEDSMAPLHSSLTRMLKEFSTGENNFGPKTRIEVKVIKDEKEYFIANVVPKDICVTEAFLLVDENEGVKKLEQIVKIDKSS